MTHMARIYHFPDQASNDEGRPPDAERSPRPRPAASRHRRRPVSHKATDWAWTQPVRGTRQHVLLALAKRARPKSEVATPSMPELVEMTGLTENTIRAHIKALVDLGVIQAERSNGGRHKRSAYTLMVAVPADSGSPTPQEMRGSEVDETPQQVRSTTPQQVTCSEPETPHLLRRNPSADAPVVLRTKSGTRGGSTSDAAASADDQAAMFDVEPTPPVKAGRSLAVVERKELAQANAGHAVAAWCEGYAETHDAKPTARQIGQVGRESRQLFESGNAPERVIRAARLAGARGVAMVEREHNAMAKRRDVAQPPAQASAPRESTTDARVRAGLALAAKYEAQEAG